MSKTKNTRNLKSILGQSKRGHIPSPEEIKYLLKLDETDKIDALFRMARDIRRKHFGEKVFLYGFLYISTYCRNDCRFCFFRKSNTESRRYRKNINEISQIAGRLSDSGVHLIDLTMGEDPAYLNNGARGFEKLVTLAKSIGRTTELPIMMSPGVIPDPVLNRLAKAGTDWYACYQETHQRELFQHLRPAQNYDARMQTKQSAHKLGMLIEEGILRGVGETADDLANSIGVMRDLDADQIRVMNFVPQCGTPMEDREPQDIKQELLTTAVLRLSFPDRLIPASLDVDGLDGLKQRLNAGANVVTSIVPPGQGLAGVARNTLDIETGRRTTASVRTVLETSGLRAATNNEYDAWITGRKDAVLNRDFREKNQ